MDIWDVLPWVEAVVIGAITIWGIFCTIKNGTITAKELLEFGGYIFLLAVPVYAAIELHKSGHTILAILIAIYSLYTLLLRHDHVNK